MSRILRVIVDHLIIFCLSSPPAVWAGVPSGEGTRHHHLGHSSEGEGHKGVSAVSQLSLCHPQHPPASRPAGLRSATQVQYVSMSTWITGTIKEWLVRSFQLCGYLCHLVNIFFLFSVRMLEGWSAPWTPTSSSRTAAFVLTFRLSACRNLQMRCLTGRCPVTYSSTVTGKVEDTF